MLRTITLAVLGCSLLSVVVAGHQQEEATTTNRDPRQLRSARHALIDGGYATGEIVSKTMFGTVGKQLRVVWRAKPAEGDCVISLFSIFNSDLLFATNIPDSQKPPWTEIAIETFGGSAGNSQKQFQTQYISQSNSNAPPTQRGQQHVVNHFTSQADIPDIYDGKFHNFEIRWEPKDGNKDSRIWYLLDGKTIRSVNGGDANLLVPPLDIYAGVWTANKNSGWACTARRRQRRELQQSGYCNYSGCNGQEQGGSWCNQNSSRCTGSCGGTWCTGSTGGGGGTPDFEEEVEVQYIRVWEKPTSGGGFTRIANYQFSNQNDVTNNFVISDWTFGSFDGAFDASAVAVDDNTLLLGVLEN